MSDKIGIGEVRRGKERVNRKEKGMKNEKKEGNNKKMIITFLLNSANILILKCNVHKTFK